jgi:hypothetical protein
MLTSTTQLGAYDVIPDETPPDVRDRLLNALASNDLATFSSVLDAYVSSGRCQYIHDLSYSVLLPAIDQNKSRFVQHLIRAGIETWPNFASYAVESRAKVTPKVFLQNQWDINRLHQNQTNPNILQ